MIEQVGVKFSAASRHLVDPELLPFLDLFPDREICDENLTAIRSSAIAVPVDPEISSRVTVTRLTAPGPAGAPAVGLTAYRPKVATGLLGCILHIHGGGYVSGSVKGMESSNQSTALKLGCAVVAVDYRLAPETRFPGAVEDCYAALTYVAAEASALGIDGTRLGVMGESAGGGLAAALALLARDRAEHRLAFQHLIYPMLDDRTCTRPDAAHRFGGDFVWTRRNNLYGWAALLGADPGTTDVSPYAAPARAESLGGLPPTFIATGALDLFADEDIDYARRLLIDGVSTELHVYPGSYHAFDFLPGPDVSHRARRDSLAALKRAMKSSS